MTERRGPTGTRPELTHIPTEHAASISLWTEWGDNPEAPLIPGFLNMTHGVVDGIFARTPRGRLFTAFQTDSTGKNMVFIARSTGASQPSMTDLVGYFEAKPMPQGERRGNASHHYASLAFIGLRTGGRAYGTDNGLVYMDYGPTDGDTISTYVLRTVMSSGRSGRNTALADSSLTYEDWHKQDPQDLSSSDDPLSSIELPDDLGTIQIPTSIILGSSSMI
ncbi:MAG: hypothetical protein WBO77_01335 [Microgenomates group bacterium]